MTGLSRLVLLIQLPLAAALLTACSGESASDGAKQGNTRVTGTTARKPGAGNNAAGKPAAQGTDAQRPESKRTEKTTGGATILSEIAVFHEVEPGVEPYRTRYITNEHFLRIDDGRDTGGYILFDRRKKIIYSVVPENEAITVIKNRFWLEKLPKQYKVSIKRYVDNNAPLIQGARVVNLSLTVNGKLCVAYQLAPGILKKTVRAEMAYRSVLASGHFFNIEKTPKKLRDACFAVVEIYHHSLQLKTGMVIRRVTWQKKQKLLVDFKTGQPVNRKLFTLPAYKRYRTGG